MQSKLVPLVRSPFLASSSLILIAHCNVVWMQLLQFVDEKYNTHLTVVLRCQFNAPCSPTSAGEVNLKKRAKLNAYLHIGIIDY